MILLENEFREFRDLKKGEQLYVGCDTSFGCGDSSVAQFFSSKRFDFPMVYETNKIATEMTDDIFPILNYVYDETGLMPLVAYERQNGGAFEMERLAKLNKEGKFDIFRMPINDNGIIKKSDKLGWDTTTATRPQMLGHFKEAIDARLIRIYDKATLDEMYSFIRVQHSNAVKAEAEKNAHDDLVMAAGIAYEMYLLYPELGNQSNYAEQVKKYAQRQELLQSRGVGGY